VSLKTSVAVHIEPRGKESVWFCETGGLHSDDSVLCEVTYRSAGKSLPGQKGNKLQRQKILMFILYPNNHNWRNISTIYIRGLEL